MNNPTPLYELDETLASNLPVLSLDMLIRFCSTYTILHTPEKRNRKFRWFALYSSTQQEVSATIPEEQIIFICHPDAARQLLQTKPQAFALILTAQNACPEWLPAHSNNALCLYQDMTLSYFAYLIQQYIIQLLMWENHLDKVVYQHGTFSALLDVGSSLLGNPLFVFDSDLNLLGSSQNSRQLSAKYRRLVALGSIEHSSFGVEPAKVLKDELLVMPPSQLLDEPFVRVLHPIYVQGSFFGITVMACSNNELSEGLCDLFMMLQKRAGQVAAAFFKQNILAFSPHYFFFCKLLQREFTSELQILEQLRHTNIPVPSQLKLLVLEQAQKHYLGKQAQIKQAVEKINGGKCYYIPYKDDVLVLCYAAEGDSQLSHKKSRKEMATYLYEPFGVPCGTSQIFEQISDIDLAYQQAKIALGLREVIDNEMSIPSERGKKGKGVYAFEEALIYYLVGNVEKDERFLRFSFSRTLAQKLYEEDLRYGTNIYELLWFYLVCERNATLTAQYLKLHRNTVLYHIHKLQERFDFDLSLQDAREKMLADYRAHFLVTNHKMLDTIIDVSSSEAL